MFGEVNVEAAIEVNPLSGGGAVVQFVHFFEAQRVVGFFGDDFGAVAFGGRQS